jgi:creatinine amidohydrolase
MAYRNWIDLKTTDFAGLDPDTTIVVQPVAAVEQHGPHLPVGTDTLIAEGMLAEVRRQCPADLDLLVLPIQAVGKSNEHIRSPGTVTLTAHDALSVWTGIGEAVHRAGLRKFVFVNSHGGNADLISIVARELRVRFQMLAVHCAWSRLGRPPGLYTDVEIAHGIHGGDVETSLMLHFRPELVDMAKARDFAPTSLAMAQEFKHLRPTGVSAFGWIAQDIHPDGTAGDATIATADKGAATCAFQAAAFLDLVSDMCGFALSRLA